MDKIAQIENDFWTSLNLTKNDSINLYDLPLGENQDFDYIIMWHIFQGYVPEKYDREMILQNSIRYVRFALLNCDFCIKSLLYLNNIGCFNCIDNSDYLYLYLLKTGNSLRRYNMDVVDILMIKSKPFMDNSYIEELFVLFVERFEKKTFTEDNIESILTLFMPSCLHLVLNDPKYINFFIEHRFSSLCNYLFSLDVPYNFVNNESIKHILCDKEVLTLLEAIFKYGNLDKHDDNLLVEIIRTRNTNLIRCAYENGFDFTKCNPTPRDKYSDYVSFLENNFTGSQICYFLL